MSTEKRPDTSTPSDDETTQVVDVVEVDEVVEPADEVDATEAPADAVPADEALAGEPATAELPVDQTQVIAQIDEAPAVEKTAVLETAADETAVLEPVAETRPLDVEPLAETFDDTPAKTTTTAYPILTGEPAPTRPVQPTPPLTQPGPAQDAAYAGAFAEPVAHSITETPVVVSPPEAEPRRLRLRVGTVVWGLVIAACGLGVLAWAGGARIDFQLALIILLAVAGSVLLIGSLVSGARSARR